MNQDDLDKYSELLQEFDELSFNILEFERKLANRNKALPLMTYKALDQLNLIEDQSTGLFLDDKKL